MKRSISNLLTTLLFAAAIMPNAMAQPHKSGFSVASSIGSADIPEQPASDATKPTSMNIEVLPEPPKSPAPAVSTINSERSRPSVDSSYPAYCSSLPAGTKPEDWEYREALYECLHGS